MSNLHNKKATPSLFESLKDNKQDFEFYPTTDEILNCIIEDMNNTKKSSKYHNVYFRNINTVLDIGAGDGRVLDAIGNVFGLKKRGIEKSSILKEKWDKSILPIGSDFNEVTLIDKKSDIIFCNPPYKEYVNWTCRILEEGNFEFLYLVIPKRWSDNERIKEVIENRKFDYQVIGEFDFLEADRKARAYIEVIRFDKTHYTKEAFSYFYNKQFKTELDDKRKDNIDDEVEEKKEDTIDFIKNEVVTGSDFVQRLVKLHENELSKLVNGMATLASVDDIVMNMLNISKNEILEKMKININSLKYEYWKLLFDRLDKITNRLTSKSRDELMKQMNSTMLVDFTVGNVYDVVIWIIKNANDFIDEQIKDVYLSLFSEKNITNYKSNKNAFSKWRYEKDFNTLYGLRAVLDYRVVLGGYWSRAIKCPDDWGSQFTNNLHDNAHTKINDIITIAHNLDFKVKGTSYDLGNWESGQKKYLYFETSNKEFKKGTKTNLGIIEDIYYHKEDNYYQYYINKQWYHEDFVKPVGSIFAEVKAYKNGNIHFKFNQKFIKALNIKAAALLGWVKNKDEFEAETGIKISDEEAEKYLNKNKILDFKNSVALLTA